MAPTVSATASPSTSLTTTRAPSAASASAWARPIPRAAPVTTHTRPSHIPVIEESIPSLGDGERGRAVGDPDVATDVVPLQLGQHLGAEQLEAVLRLVGRHAAEDQRHHQAAGVRALDVAEQLLGDLLRRAPDLQVGEEAV